MFLIKNNSNCRYCSSERTKNVIKLEDRMSAITAIYMTERQCPTLDQGSKIMSALTEFPCHTSQAWHNDNVFLGCHNQWITPESINELNPFYDRERQLVITADAIIDNRKELFDLLDIPYARRVHITDAELILLSYSKWEREAPKFLIGDFAFIIWDEREQRLFAARDFSGSRTLYYHWNGKRLVLCTTMNPLLDLPHVEKRLNEQWLAQYLAINTAISTVDSTSNVFKDIWQIPPSHSITIAGGHINISRYCTIKTDKKLRFKKNEQYIEAFQEVFQEAVNTRLRTYRRVGSELSGGLDSGAVTAFAARALRTKNKQLHTFSYIPAKDFIDYTPKHSIANESHFIQSTVQHIGGISAHYLDFEDRNSFIEIDSYLDILEMPYKNYMNSFWIRGIFEKAAEKDVGVFLTGARGNLTISWGDAVANYTRLFKQLRWLRLLQELKAYSFNMGAGRAWLLSVMVNRAYPMRNKNKSEQSAALKPIINAEFAKKTRVFEQLRKHGFDESGMFTKTNAYHFRKWHFEDLFHWNSTNTLNTKMSLASGVWSRDPTNDIRVIQFCLSVPEDQYVQNGLDRALIRRATEHYLPDKIRLNQRVRGVQGADWLHRMLPHWPSFIEDANEMSKDDRMMGFVNSSLIKEALTQYKYSVQPQQANDGSLRDLMWSLIVYRFLKRNL